MSNVSAQKKVVEQLRQECTFQRVPLSETIKDMIGFIEGKKEEDFLLIGIDKKTNPFQEKSSCTII